MSSRKKLIRILVSIIIIDGIMASVLLIRPRICRISEGPIHRLITVALKRLMRIRTRIRYRLVGFPAHTLQIESLDFCICSDMSEGLSSKIDSRIESR